MASKEFSKKLRELRIKAGFTQKYVYDFLGLPQSTFSSWEIGKSEPSADMLLKLCDLYGVEDIMYEFGYDGKNEDGDIVPSYSELQLIEKYRIVKDKNPTGKELIDYTLNHEYTRCTTPQQPDTIEENITPYNVLPFSLSEYKASAGRGAYLGPEAFTIIMVEKNDLTKRALFGVPVSGDSMEPTYYNGDILIVERADALEIGEIGVFTLDGEGYVKQCGDGKLTSLSKKYEPIPMNESIVLNGRVIGILDKEWIAE